jgi:hypothetical protein
MQEVSEITLATGRLNTHESTKIWFHEGRMQGTLLPSHKITVMFQG